MLDMMMCPGDTAKSPPASPKSLVSLNSSVLASPSSLAQGAGYFPGSLAKDPANRRKMDTSFSSQARLISNNSSFGGRFGLGHDKYDFAPVVLTSEEKDHVAGTEVVLVSSDLNNLSAMSHSVAIEQESVNENCRAVSEHSAADYHDDFNQSAAARPQKIPPDMALDGSLMRQKSINQKRLREELFVALLERLQDELKLVEEVENLQDPALMGDWFSTTPMDKEGLLTGFSKKNRTGIIRNLTAILNEMDRAPTEEFLMSPSDMSRFLVTHDDLHDAILFCRKLVDMAIPESEMERGQGRWKFREGMRSAVGLVPPESPEILRGGDTSFFSLPSDSAETPMTSNVSVTTTITSAVTTPNGGGARSRPFKYPGLHLRRSIEIVAALLQKMSIACQRLCSMGNETWNLSAQDSISVTEDIKRTYLQIQAVDVTDMKALVDAFQLETSGHMLIRNISSDEDEIPQPPPFALQPILPPAPPVLPHRGLQARRSPRRHTALLPREHRRCNRNHVTNHSIGVNSDPGFFSPSSEDIRTWAENEEEDDNDDDRLKYDDLRRTVGSTDYDDAVEEREGPECDERENCDDRNADNKVDKCCNE